MGFKYSRFVFLYCYGKKSSTQLTNPSLFNIFVSHLKKHLS